MRKRVCLILAVFLASAHGSARGGAPDPLTACDVTWTELGHDSQDSMPIGNGDLGLNVWTEQNGDLLFYIGKTDAWDESNKGDLVKVGRVRVSLTPNPFAGNPAFTQTLRLREAEIVLAGGGTTLRVWVDANAPAIHVETASSQPIGLAVTLDPWRAQSKDGITADVVLPGEKDRLTWYHNTATAKNPHLRDRTFGGTIRGDGLVRVDERTLRTGAPVRAASVAVSALTTVGIAPEEWRTRLGTQAERLGRVPFEQARAAHRQWWQEFWQRSWIFVTGDADAARVTQGYVLQRFITACAGRGAYPIKFNGSIFVADNPSNTTRPKGATEDVPAPMTADERTWGPQYWFQNTRAIYWPRLMAGDYDFMQPLFRMYAEIVKTNAASVAQYYGHRGSYMAETAPFWGGIPDIKPGEAGSYTKHYYTPVLELTAMGLDYYAHTRDAAFAREILVPTAAAGLTFFAEHFGRDAAGKLSLEPDNAIEMYWIVRNPLPDIAGLHYVLDGLLALPRELVDDATRQDWEKLRAELPPVPLGTRDGKTVLLPYQDGQVAAPGHNSENPELYAVYPFRLYGLGKPDLTVALDTFAARLNKRTGCWYQDPVQAAYLGLVDVAKKDVVFNFTTRSKRLRFPAFWGQSHDYDPDEDNGGNGELALQLMLMQCEGNRIQLLPAWPKEWEADFKLHAPGQTTVQGHVKGGRIIDLTVTPASRRADVTISAPAAPAASSQ